jgi:ankyrin repeat protein
MKCRARSTQTHNAHTHTHIHTHTHTHTLAGMTGIHIAAKFGNIRVIDVLLANSMSIDMPDEMVCSPPFTAEHLGMRAIMLHSAQCVSVSPKRAQESRRKTHVAVVYVLCGAQGWTPLHHACCAGRNTTVGYLLEKNANVNADNKNNETPLHLAFGNGHMEIIRLLMQVSQSPWLLRAEAIHLLRLRTQRPLLLTCP